MDDEFNVIQESEEIHGNEEGSLDCEGFPSQDSNLGHKTEILKQESKTSDNNSAAVGATSSIEPSKDVVGGKEPSEQVRKKCKEWCGKGHAFQWRKLQK